jgi:hypothetical protein
MSKLMSRADAARYFEENGISHAKRKLDEYAMRLIPLTQGGL